MAFRNFFREGSVGRDLFEKKGTGIRSYLTIEDLLRCSEAHGTGLSDGLCATYTVSEILQKMNGMYQSRPEHEIDTVLSDNLERIVLEHVHSFMNSDAYWYVEYNEFKKRPTRYYLEGRFLYHPEELTEIYQIVMFFLRARGSILPVDVEVKVKAEASIANTIWKTYVLRGATFWSCSRSVDVTAKIKELVKSHFGCLVLHRYLAPEGVEWYFCSLFGDIEPRKTKSLNIRVMDPETGQVSDFIFLESETVVLKLDIDDQDIVE